MLKILLILLVIFLIYYIIKQLKNKPRIENFSINQPAPLILKVIADDYLGIYHEINPKLPKLTDEMIRTELIDTKYPNNKKIVSENGTWLEHPNLPRACCNKLIEITIPNFKINDRLLFFVGNMGGPGYVAGQIEYNGRTYYTDAFNEDIWNCIGVLPGLSVKGLDAGDLSKEFPTEGGKYLGSKAKPITGNCSGNQYFTKFLRNQSKFLHKYYRGQGGVPNNIIATTEEAIKKYGYGIDNCRNLDKHSWLVGVEDYSPEKLGCYTNDLAFYNDKIFWGWYRDDIIDSELEKVLANFYGKVSNIPVIILWVFYEFGIKFNESKLFDDTSSKEYPVDEYYEKLSLLLGIDTKDRNTIRQMLPILEPTKCNPVNLDNLIDFDKGKDISKEFQKKYKSNPFWYKSGKKMGCFKDSSSCLVTKLTNKISGNNYTEEQCRHKAMKNGDKFYGLQEGGVCKTSGNNPKTYEKLNFREPSKECISDNQCMIQNSATWGQVLGSNGNNLVYSNDESPKLVNASTINEFNSGVYTNFDELGTKCNLLTTEPELLGGMGGFKGNEFYGYIVIEFKPKTNTVKFCPDPAYKEWNPKGCSVRSNKNTCSATPINYRKYGRFIPDDSLCKTFYEKLKPVSLNAGGKVNDPSIMSISSNINTNFTALFNECVLNIRKSINNNAPQSDTKGHVSKNNINEFIEVLYEISKNCQSILGETDVWDASKSKLEEFITDSSSNLSLLSNKIKRSYEKWALINLKQRTKDGSGAMGTLSDKTNKTGDNMELYNQFEKNYNNLAEKIRIISKLCVCSDNMCDDVCGIEVEPEPEKEKYHRLSISKPIKHFNKDVKCQLKRGKYIGSGKYMAIWDCGTIKSIPMKFRDWTPNISGKVAKSMKINVYQAKHGEYRYKMEPVIFDKALLGNSASNCKKAATHYGIKPGRSWGCADQLTKSWWSGKDSQKQGRGPIIRNGQGCNSRPDRNSSNYKKECKRLRFIQGIGKTSVNDEEWWKVNTQNGLIPENFWAFRADSESTRPDGAVILYISQYGSNKKVRRYKFSMGRACCGWSPYFSIWVYKTKDRIPTHLQSKAKKFYVAQTFQPYHRFAVSTKSIKQGWTDVFQFWAFSSNPGDIANDKLDRCEADCDTDADCKNGLICNQRNGYDIVPGCLPGGKGDVSGGDYCIPKENIYNGRAKPANIYQSEKDNKISLRIRGRNRQGQIQNRTCNLDQRYAINSNNRAEVIWNCNEDSGNVINIDENTKDIKTFINNKLCKLSHNPRQKGKIDAEWDCTPPPLGSIKINRK